MYNLPWADFYSVCSHVTHLIRNPNLSKYSLNYILHKLYTKRQTTPVFVLAAVPALPGMKEPGSPVADNGRV